MLCCSSVLKKQAWLCDLTYAQRRPEHKKQWTERTALVNTEDQNGGDARSVANLLCTDCIVIAELKSLNSTLSLSFIIMSI